MKPKPMLTLLFVKRFFLVFIGGLILLFTFPQFGTIIWSIIFITGFLMLFLMQSSFPKTQITVDEETICFKRKFPSWHPLKKYYLHELIIPHADWDSWIKTIRSNEDSAQYCYLFFKDQRLRFVAETLENGDLEYWIQKKFPDRTLETKHPFIFSKYDERIDHLKEKDRMKVF